MKLVAFHHEDQNAALLDPWSLVHLSVGLFAGLIGVGAIPSLAVATAYEAFEQFAERQPWGSKIFRTSGAETPQNIALDLGLFMAGWWMGAKYNDPT